MEKDTDKTTENAPLPSAYAKALKIVAYPLSLALGVFYAHAKTRNESYNNFRSGHMFDDLRKIRELKAIALLKETGVDVSPEALKAIELDHVPPEVKPEQSKNFIAEQRKIQGEYAAAAEKRILDKGYTNIWKRFQALNTNQMLETSLKFATVTGASLGVMFALANSKYLQQRVNNFTGEDKSNSR